MKPQWHEFTSRDEVADTLADAVVGVLADAIAERGSAILAVSGGSTPPLFFKALSARTLDWSRVIVTLVDERFVPPSSERSNARLVAQHLLQKNAAGAEFLGLYHERKNVEEAADLAEQDFRNLPLPLDAAVLGMGLDGHTASLFPDASNLSELLDSDGQRHVLPVHAQGAVEPRLTLSLPLICRARFLALHIEGSEKKEALQSALDAENGQVLPVRAVLENSAAPVQVFWAPKEDGNL